MSLPPGILAQQLVRIFPQFILCDSALNAALGSYLNPAGNQAMSDLVQWLQDHSDIANAAGNVLNPDNKPQTSAAPLDAALVAEVDSSLGSTSSWIVTQPDFSGVAWTVQDGVLPGPLSPQPATGAWTLSTFGPLGGVQFTEIAYSGPVTNSFTLKLVNGIPRHLSVYAEFSKNGTPVEPANWTSRLPATAPSGFETATVKYVGALVPNVAVAGIPVAATPQTVQIALPSNADAVRLLFGGLGNQGFQPVPDAAGVLWTLVLDVLVPWVIAYSGKNVPTLSTWYADRLNDPTLRSSILESGAFLLGIDGEDAMFSALSTGLTDVLLGKPLAGLRKVLTELLGPPSGKDYSWVDRLAPAAGWAAQELKAFLPSPARASYWAVGTQSALAVDLSPATTLALNLELGPDPKSGIWPYDARSYVVEIVYSGGFSQTLSGQIPPAPSTDPIAVAFGSVAAAGLISIDVRILDAAQSIVALASTDVRPTTSGALRDVNVALSVSDLPVTLSAASRYSRVERLAFVDGAYSWTAVGGASPVAPPLFVAAVAAVSALTCLTVQGDERCLGYAWRTSNQEWRQCGSKATLQSAYFMQNIGTAVPASELKTINCGLVSAPILAYSPFTGEPLGSFDGGTYLDTQGSAVFVRPVIFGSGQFDLESKQSIAHFSQQSGLVALCMHPAGYAAAINGDQATLQICALASAPVPDASAPTALSYCGAGTRIGLLGGPVAIATMPNGLFAVLEQGNARVQAFDLAGNPVPAFGGQAAFSLRSVKQPSYRDIAISASGAIYVLGSQNGGTSSADFFVDIYDPNGTLLTTTQGVYAAKIAVDECLTLYTLDFESMVGPNGRIEPVLSIWRPLP